MATKTQTYSRNPSALNNGAQGNDNISFRFHELFVRRINDGQLRHHWSHRFQDESSTAIIDSIVAHISNTFPAKLKIDFFIASIGFSQDFLTERADRLSPFDQHERAGLFTALGGAYDRHRSGEDVVELSPASLPAGLRIQTACRKRAFDRFRDLCINDGMPDSPGLVWSLSLPNLEPEESDMRNRGGDIESLVNVLREKLIPILVDELVPLLKTLIAKNDAVLSRIIVPTRSNLEPELSLLTEKQRRVFERIDAARGTDAVARKQVQKLFHELDGDQVTEALAQKLKQAIKSRCWGIRCSCGEPAQYMWQRNRRCAQGGLLVLSHQTDGKHHVHAATTVFRTQVLIPKPDRRTGRI